MEGPHRDGAPSYVVGQAPAISCNAPWSKTKQGVGIWVSDPADPVAGLTLQPRGPVGVRGAAEAAEVGWAAAGGGFGPRWVGQLGASSAAALSGLVSLPRSGATINLS